MDDEGLQAEPRLIGSAVVLEVKHLRVGDALLDLLLSREQREPLELDDEDVGCLADLARLLGLLRLLLAEVALPIVIDFFFFEVLFETVLEGETEHLLGDGKGEVIEGVVGLAMLFAVLAVDATGHHACEYLVDVVVVLDAVVLPGLLCTLVLLALLLLDHLLLHLAEEVEQELVAVVLLVVAELVPADVLDGLRRQHRPLGLPHLGHEGVVRAVVRVLLLELLLAHVQHE